MTRRIAGIGMVFAVSSLAAAQEGADPPAPPAPPPPLAPPEQEPAVVEPGEFKLDEPATLAFGSKGAHRWSVGAGVALNGSATDVNAYGMAHFFIADEFEFNLTLGAWYHDQDGDDAGSGNLALGFRWHFVNEPAQSWYFDFGVGVLGSTDDVPDEGTGFNFTPRAGIGTTIAIDGWDGARLDLGVRWHHISNANISGSDENPDRDSVMVYVGVMWGF